jgi:fimbrial isopeptide formation D2 family protein/uncharacterized repeat protein (TIGR01451 family)
MIRSDDDSGVARAILGVDPVIEGSPWYRLRRRVAASYRPPGGDLKRRALGALLSAVLIGAVVVLSVDDVSADGTPDIAFSASMASETLYGASTSVTLTASNSTGTDAYNLSFNDVLPPGATYVLASGSPEPTSQFIDVDGNQVLIWENVADLQAGTTVSVSYSFLADNPDYVVGDTVTNDAGAYVNTDPRLVPDFDPLTGAATGDFTGFGTGSTTTQLVPFTLDKSEGNTEAELLRGVHDHKTVHTITVANNLVNATNDFQIEDWLPAGLEFLGCGGVDNSTPGAEEYPGSGRIDDTGDPALVNCVTPSTVETVTVDPDGGGPLSTDVYTHVVWTAADLNTATPGQDDLGAGAVLTLDYVTAIPLRENVLFPGGTAITGVQTANLDNNTGDLTADEQGLTNYATAAGTYTGPFNGPGPLFTESATELVTAEDVSIHKSVDVGTIEQTDVSTWTLFVETSEYATSTTGITVTDILPDGLCPIAAGTPCAGAGAAPSPSPASVVENGDGTWTIVWNLADLPAPNSTSTITFRSQAEASYTTGGGPVAANDSWTNTVSLSSTSAVITDNDGSTSSLSIGDDSSAGQSAGGISILKEVSEPVGGTLTCGDGSALTWNATAAGPYRPGDRVCWRLTVTFPALLDTLDVSITDFLPAGFTFESSAFGANHDAVGFAFDGAAPVPTWSNAGVDIGGETFEAVVSSVISDPQAAGDGDILANLMKVTYENTVGNVFQLRDQADAVWAEPQLTLDKGVIDVDDVAVPVPPADDVGVQELDVVTYQVSVTNTGSIAALTTSVRDVLPAGITCSDVSIPAGPPVGVCSDLPDGWIQWDGITVPALGTVDLTYDVTIPDGTAAGTDFDNTAGVRRYESPTNRAAPDDSQVYVPSSNIDSTLEPSANTDPAWDPSRVFVAAPTIDKARTTSIVEAGNPADQATIGETISYTITVVIPEGANLYGPATVTDSLSARITHAAGTAVATLDTGTGPAALPPGWTLTDTGTDIMVTFPDPYENAADSGDDVLVITFDATVDDESANTRLGSAIPNTGRLDWEDAAGNPSSDTDNANTRVVEPNLSITKTDDDVDGILSPGQDVVFTVTPANVSGTRVSVAHDVEVIDTVPDELTPLEAPGDPAEDGDTIPASGGVWDATARTITWTIASLDPGDSSPLTYTARADDPLLGSASVSNTADVTASSRAGVVDERDATSPNGGPGSGYQASATNNLTAPALAVVKSATPTSATVGETVEYTLDVTIPAGVILYDVIVVDDLPTGIIYDSTTATSCTEAGGACSPGITATPVLPVPLSHGDPVAWFLGDLGTPAAGDRVVTITYEAYLVDVGAVVNGATLTNSAVAVGNQTNQPGPPVTPPDPATYDVSSPSVEQDITVIEPTLTIDKDVNGQQGDSDTRRAVPGDTLTFTITIENTGTSPAFDIDVTDTAHPDLILVDVPAGAGYTIVDGTPPGLEWNVAGPLAAGDTFSLTYQMQVPPGFDETDEVPAGPEFENTADVPHYFAVAPADQVGGRTYRDYDDVTADVVSIEADLASVGDRVWFDIDGDGTQDVGEPGLSGIDVTVTYLGPDNTFGTGDDEAVTVTTGAGGDYLVEDLPGGQYRVSVDAGDVPLGMGPSFDLDGTPDGEWNGVLGEDEAKRDVDFGYTGTGSIGDTVWFDLDGDGTVDGGEPGLPGVDVTVTWLGFDDTAGGGDDVVYSTVTAADGTYLADGLPAGEYTVVVDSGDLPPGFSQVSDPDATLDDETDLTLGAGTDELDIDFGYRGSGSIGDFVWLDTDGDGTQDAGEPGVESVTVQLTWDGPDGGPGGGDDVVFSTSTGVDGAYLFEYLPAGGYIVDVLGGLPALVSNSFDEDNDNDSSTPVTLATGEDHLTADFGYFGSTSIGDRVWWDLNADGVQDAGEPGLGGVEVTVVFAGADGTFGNLDDETFVAVTNSNGDYLVTGLPAGDFRVSVTDGIAPGFTVTYDEDDGVGAPDGVTEVLGLGAVAHLTADFGYVGAGSIGDTVWLDLNNNGIQDAGEDGIELVTIDLAWLGPDGVAGGGDDIVLQTVTDPAGGYAFGGLPAGTFTVTVDDGTLPGGLRPTFDLDGTPDDTTDVTLAAAESRTDADFGYRPRPPSSDLTVGDTVWLDLDGDGTQDAGEPGVSGVTVTLTESGNDGLFGTSDDVVRTQATDGAGGYVFTDVTEGPVRVTIDPSTLSGGLSPSSDVDGGDPAASELTLDSERLDIDFAVTGTSSLTGLVWEDADADGVRDPGEEGLVGVVVDITWLGPGGTAVFTVTTGADGTWALSDIPGGDYTAEVRLGTVPPGYSPSTPISVSVSVPNGGSGFVSHGVTTGATIGSIVWIDTDLDGVPDPNESGLAGVVVELVDESGQVVATVTTASDGSYIFTGVVPGTYTVRLVPSSLPSGVLAVHDLDGVLDFETQVTVLAGMSILDANFGFASGVLPFTGLELGVALLGLVLALVGSLTLSTTRRVGRHQRS